MKSVLEPSRSLPVIEKADLCVVGGSCTGVFAAVRAARLGLKVVIVEAHNCFGGVATNAMVNIWHSLHDIYSERQIIAGLTQETIELLKKRHAVDVKQITKSSKVQEYYVLNTEELKIELDNLVISHHITPYLHTLFSAPYVNPENGVLEGIIVENKDGRSVILANTFIDASGDGDLAARLELPTYRSSHLQPGTTCAKISNLRRVEGFADLYREHREAYDLPETFIWNAVVPNQETIAMLSASRVAMDMSNAQQLTRAEMEGRRQVRAILDLIRQQTPHQDVNLIQLPARIGVRETRHVKCALQLNGQELLTHGFYDDAIANGTYESDIHHPDKSGITFSYLNGEQVLSRPGYAPETTRWRQPLEREPTFYQIPYRAMLPAGAQYPNLIVAGRMIDADAMAHGAIRVMVNMNQVGEAAGVAAALALNHRQSFHAVPPAELRRELERGGSLVV